MWLDRAAGGDLPRKLNIEHHRLNIGAGVQFLHGMHGGDEWGEGWVSYDSRRWAWRDRVAGED